MGRELLLDDVVHATNVRERSFRSVIDLLDLQNCGSGGNTTGQGTGIDQEVINMPSVYSDSLPTSQTGSRVGVSYRVGWGGGTQPTYGNCDEPDQVFSLLGAWEGVGGGVDARSVLEVAREDDIMVKEGKEEERNSLGRE